MFHVQQLDKKYQKDSNIFKTPPVYHLKSKHMFKNRHVQSSSKFIPKLGMIHDLNLQIWEPEKVAPLGSFSLVESLETPSIRPPGHMDCFGGSKNPSGKMTTHTHTHPRNLTASLPLKHDGWKTTFLFGS